MINPRKKINLTIVVILLVLVGFLFYQFFPKIFGDVLYPLEYRQNIIDASNEFHVDRNLIAAVIYVESHFNPNAGSGAGARGLMQLMPSTARGVARNIGLTSYTDGQIYDPAVNIRLGTAYLRSSLDSRGGNLDVALSNYNGGPAVAGAFQVALNRNVLPRETDAYIRKVKDAQQSYTNIYGTDWTANQDGSNMDTGNPFTDFTIQIPSSFVSQINIKNIFGSLLGK
jgi:soluble lytic murein transglycosylase